MNPPICHLPSEICHSQASLALVAVNRPDGVTVEYLYEGDNDSRLPLPNPNTGRLKKIVQPRGDTTFGYDSAGRLANLTAPDGGVLSYAYDGSLLLSTTWSNGEVNGSVSRTYDNNFWVTSESVNGANTVGFTYDLDGLLTGANTTVGGSAVNFVIARDPDNGLITGSSIGGVSDSISYNGFAEPIGYTATFNGTKTLYDVSYVRDAIGRISSKTETVNGVTTTYGYHYDLAGRLTGVDENGVPSSTYTYDSNGNRLSYSGELGSFTGTYDAQDRLLSYGDFVYEYTANGELSKKTNSVTGAVWEYEYNSFSDLIGVQLPSGRRIDYILDAYARRIGKKVDGVVTKRWLYGDRYRIVAELDATGEVESHFIYSSKYRIPDYVIKDGISYRIVSDYNSTPKLVVRTSDGAEVQQLNFSAYGKETVSAGPCRIPFGYTGGLWDEDTGLLHFGHREYDPSIGRWLTKEPLGFYGSLNFYEYAFGDPINFFDFTGKAPGDTFETPDDAARDAIDYSRNNPDYDNEYFEYGGYIEETPDGYTYDEPIEGHGAGNLDLPDPPDNAEAIWHTHPMDGEDVDMPSKRDIRASDKTGLPVYTGGGTGITSVCGGPSQSCREVKPPQNFCPNR